MRAGKLGRWVGRLVAVAAFGLGATLAGTSAATADEPSPFSGGDFDAVDESPDNATWDGDSGDNATWDDESDDTATWDDDSSDIATWDDESEDIATWDGATTQNATWD